MIFHHFHDLIFDLCDSSGMSFISGKFRVKEGIHNLYSQAGACNTGTQRQNIGVIMFSRCLRRKTISAQSSTYSFKSICCNRNTNSCSTDCYSNLGLLFIFQICSIRGIFSECVSFASLFMLYYNGRKSNTRRFDWPGTVLAVLRTVSLMNLRIPEKMRK